MRGGGRRASTTPRSASGSSSTLPHLMQPSSPCTASRHRWDLRPDCGHQSLCQEMQSYLVCVLAFSMLTIVSVM